MQKELVFHIDNLSYSFNVEPNLEKNLVKFVNTDVNISTKELLLAYIRLANEHTALQQDLEEISSLLPKL